MATEPAAALRRRQYERPPVVEAVAGVHWSKPQQWNVTTAGLLYERLRDDYPAPPKTRNALEAQISPQETAPNLELRTGPQQVVFSTHDGSRIVMVGPNFLSANGLPPYEGWEALEGRLFHALENVSAVFDVEGGIDAVNLRYINRVEIPRTAILFEEYLTVGFALPSGFPQELSAFLDRAEVIYPDGATKMAFTWGSTDSPSGTSAFILDFDLTTPLEGGDWDAARLALNDLKSKETEAFESLLQPSLRGIFGEIE